MYIYTYIQRDVQFPVIHLARLIFHKNRQQPFLLTPGASATSVPFEKDGLTKMPARISIYVHYKVWGKTTKLFSNFCGAVAEVWEWIWNSLPHFTEHVVIYPYHGHKLIYVTNRTSGYQIHAQRSYICLPIAVSNHCLYKSSDISGRYLVNNLLTFSGCKLRCLLLWELPGKLLIVLSFYI